MSRCAFCGREQTLGHHFFAHRFAARRVETVKVCEGCETEARAAGFTLAEREPSTEPSAWEESGTTPP